MTPVQDDRARRGFGSVNTQTAGLLAVLLALSLALVPTAASAAPLPAFPGAEGPGADTPGGRGGRIIEVVNLDDSGPGSFRAACNAVGPRIIVFRVAGTIELERDIVLRGEEQSYVTIAGQTAPGGGVQLKRWGLVLGEGVHDVIVRHLRFRPGHTAPEDWSKAALSVVGSWQDEEVPTFTHDIVIDHCSLYWGPDETGGVWGHVRDVTFQWCIFAEGTEHNYPGYRSEGSKSLLIGPSDVGEVAVHHSYMVHSDQRNPMTSASGPTHIVNNVVYNWGHFGAQFIPQGGPVKVNFIGNYYKWGPSSVRQRYEAHVTGESPETIYVRDNIGPHRPTSDRVDWADEYPEWGEYFDEWAVIAQDEVPGRLSASMPAPESYRRLEPWPDPVIPITTVPASQVVDLVLEAAGATLPQRDECDRRVVGDFYAETGEVDKSSDWPVLSPGTPYTDSDHDGMADEWEVGEDLDPNDPTDGCRDADGDGYTNVEEFLNSMAPSPERDGSQPEA